MVQAAGELLGTGHSGNLNQRKKALWTDIQTRLNSFHGTNRVVKDMKIKWNHLKLCAKFHVRDSRREAMRTTGGGKNAIEEVKEEQLVILAADKELTNSVTERVTQMSGATPAFTGTREVKDLFKATARCPPDEVIVGSSSFSSHQNRMSLITISDGSSNENVR